MKSVMKLGSVYVAHETFKRLAGLKMPPKVAYRLLKFVRKFDAEYEVVEQQRVKLLRDAAKAKEGQDVTLKAGTPEYSEFIAGFNGVLETDSDLELCPIKMNDLLSALDAEQGNVLSAQDLAAVEGFFEADETKKET